jgi:hypothetical protein
MFLRSARGDTNIITVKYSLCMDLLHKKTHATFLKIANEERVTAYDFKVLGLTCLVVQLTVYMVNILHLSLSRSSKDPPYLALLCFTNAILAIFAREYSLNLPNL